MLKIKNSLILGLVVSFAMTSCGPSSKIVKNYTPISNISELTLDESQAPTVLYVRNDAPTLGAYDRFIIDPVIIDTRDPDAKKIDEKDAEKIKTYFQESMMKELQDNDYTVTEEAEAKTLRISFVLSGIKAPSALPNIPSVVLPLAWSVGGVTVEATFREAVSNRIDAVAINRSEGSHVANTSPWSTWDDVKKSLDKWTKGIRKSLDKAHGK